jgi:hypothetical protein
MLVKYGPPGSLWATNAPKTPQNPNGTSLLAQLTDSVYQAEQAGKLTIPIGYVQRFQRADQVVTPQGRDQLANVLAANDPLQAMLQSDAHNKNASWQVMGGPNGAGLAKMLLNGVNGDLPGLDARFVAGASSNGDYAGYFTMYAPGSKASVGKEAMLNTPDQNVVGAFLDASTSAPRGNDINAKESAQAALNIIVNTAPPIMNGSGSSVSPGYDPAIMTALTNTFMRYMPDLAVSTSPPTPGSNGIQQNQYINGNPWQIQVNSSTIDTFLMELSSTPQNYGYLKGAVAAKMGTAYGMQLNGITDGSKTDYASDYASLYGLFITEEGNLHFNAGQVTDANNAQINSLISFGESQLSLIPVVGPNASKILTYDKSLAFLGFPQIPQFSTNNAANAAQAGKQEFTTAQLQAMIPLVQGLVQQGLVTPDPAWYQNGQVICNNNFDKWWTANQLTQFDNKSLKETAPTLESLYGNIYSSMKVQNDAFSQTGK